MRLVAFGAAMSVLLAATGCEPLAEPPGTNSPTINTPDSTPSSVPTGSNSATSAVPSTGTTPESTDLPSSDPAAVTPTDSEATAPDNTAKNERDVEKDTKTPLDQGSSERDTEITAEIRQHILDMDDASINARNVKIVTVGGKVTLRGPVEDSQERDAIEQIAVKAVGADNVDNQLEVKAE